MKKTSIVSLALGSAFAAAALSPVAHAASNPFAATQLQSGYLLAEADMKSADKMPEAKCGGDKKADAKCGADKKAAEKKCGADKKSEAKCGAEKKAAEKKCGADKKMDASCGANK